MVQSETLTIRVSSLTISSLVLAVKTIWTCAPTLSNWWISLVVQKLNWRTTKRLLKCTVQISLLCREVLRRRTTTTWSRLFPSSSTTLSSSTKLWLLKGKKTSICNRDWRISRKTRHRWSIRSHSTSFALLTWNATSASSRNDNGPVDTRASEGIS